MHAVLPILLPLLEVSIPYNAHNSAPTTSFKEPVEEPCAKSEPCSCLTEDLGNLEKSFAILDVLESFGTHITKEPRFQGRWIGKPKFLGHVINRVRKNEPVELCMPAFPCKSVSEYVSIADNIFLVTNFLRKGQPRKQSLRSLA